MGKVDSVKNMKIIVDQDGLDWILDAIVKGWIKVQFTTAEHNMVHCDVKLTDCGKLAIEYIKEKLS